MDIPPTTTNTPLLSPERKMWLSAFRLAGGIFAVSLAYCFLYFQNFAITAWSEAIGGTAALMIGISYAMSGMGYYFDFLDTKVGYRKFYGLVGLLAAFIYAYTLLFVNPGRYFSGFIYNLGTADFILGILAMAILVFMVIISTPQGIKAIGAKNWRLGLRTGYLSAALFTLRAVMVFQNEWTAWLRHGHWYLPPIMLIATVFTILVILFRGSIFISQHIRPWREVTLTKKDPVTPTTSKDGKRTSRPINKPS